VSSLGLVGSAPRGFDTTIDVAAGGHVLCVSVQDYPGTTFEKIGQCRAITGAGAVTVDRVQGADRYASAAAVSRAAFPSTAPVVVVANGDAFPDALAAGPVASKLGGPLLLTQAGALPAATASEIARLKPQRIVVAGGTVSVSDAVYTALSRLTTSMARVGGVDRYDTSRRLATYAFASAGTAYVASGDAFPDALGAGAAAARASGPLLLVNAAANAGIDTPTTSLLTKLKVTRVRVAGGTAAVADGTVSRVKAAVADTKRVYGADRFETAIALSKDGFTSTSRAFIVNGMNFPDGIVTPPLAARTGSPVFLSPGTCVPKGVLAELGRLSVRTFTLVGGTTSLTADVAGMQLCA
jgi:putative cell wall-binding protein